MSKSQRTGDNHHRDDVPSFEPRKIKRERNDSFESHDINLINSNIEPDNNQQQQLRLGAGSKLSNGYHIGDLLQDVMTPKSVTNNHGNNAGQNDKIRRMIEDSLSDESKHKVQDIFLRFEQLMIEEKLLIYLKLPVSLTNLGSTTDPLRQPLNPLGNRYEIHQTIMWIRTHLVEDPDVSLPKQEVYDEYNHFCTQNSMKPLSTADFGKVMKQVYPRVKPRRLGTRGNSRYCYAGMRKRVNLSTPTLPEISGPTEEDEFDEPISEKMLGAASIVIREWAESVLGLKFPSLCALAQHLVEHLCVDRMSLSAVCILSAAAVDMKPATPKIPETPPSLSTTPVGGKSGKLREAQIQLQKKLQQREHTRDQVQNQQGKDKADVIINSGNQGKVTGIVKIKKTRNQVSSQSPQTIITQNTLLKSSSSLSTTPTTTTTTIKSRKIQKSISQASPQLNCDTMPRNNGSSTKNINDFITKEDKLPVNKNSRKRVSLDLSMNEIDKSPEKQAKLNDDDNKIIKNEVIGFKKISVVPSCTLKSKLELEKLKNNNKNKLINGTNKEIQVDNDNDNNTELLTKEEINKICENSNILERNDKLCSIDADELDDYLNGGNNSQEPEEELLQYFQQSNSSSSDAETMINPNILLDDNSESRLDKVSQIRLILEQNLKDTTLRSTIEPSTSSSTTISSTTTTTKTKPTTTTTALSKNPVQSIIPIEKAETIEKNKIILPKILNHHTTSTTNSRRRVSFETNVIDNSQELNSSSLTINTVPQSPNTRRRGFNFTPISPGPHSPINGRTASSKPGSENASPFVSPRNTPVPRSRSNMAGICRTRGQKHLARSISCSVSYTNRLDNNFVVPTTITNPTTPTPQYPLTTTNTNNKNNIESSTIDEQLICSINNETNDKKSVTCDTTSSFLSSDINSEKQLVINYPIQENLQEIKNNYRRNQQPADEEIIELFNGVKPFINEQYYRSQSVPLHRMVNPTLMSSPILSTTTQSYLSSFQSPNFNPSSGSSIAPTPVPSEFNDFGSTYLLDEYDANLIDDDQNISKILNLLDVENGKDLSILNDRNDESLMLDAIPNSNLNLNDTMLDPSSVLDPSVGNSINKLIQSRSYPNTPLPPVASSSYPPAFTEDSNGSRSSYPSTPLQTIQPQDVYRESNEPMLSSPTLNSLNLRSDNGNPGSQESVCRNVVDLLEPNFLADPDNDTDDLNTLGNFDGLQDVDTLAPLFNEVSDANR